MKQTANYHLSQWVKEDRILMDDFNADNAKIDAALRAEETARKNAVNTVNNRVTTEKNALDARITAEKNALNSAIAAETAARESAIAAAGEAELLRSATADGTAPILSLDVSGLDWSRYMLALLRVSDCGDAYFYLRCNGGGMFKIAAGSNWEGGGIYRSFGAAGFSSVLPVFRSAESPVQAATLDENLFLGHLDQPLRLCKTFSLESEEGVGNLRAGAVFSLWGIR